MLADDADDHVEDDRHDDNDNDEDDTKEKKHDSLRRWSVFVDSRPKGPAGMSGPACAEEPASSSSFRPPRPDLPQPAAATVSTEQPAGRELESHDRAPAATRKKQVQELVFYIRHNGELYGSLRFNSRAFTLTAHCEIAGHEKGTCRKQRTVRPTERSRYSTGKSGRPIGFLVHWLLKGTDCACASDHIHDESLANPSLEDRKKARAIFMELEGAADFSRQSGRPRDDDDHHDEPTVST